MSRIRSNSIEERWVQILADIPSQLRADFLSVLREVQIRYSKPYRIPYSHRLFPIPNARLLYNFHEQLIPAYGKWIPGLARTFLDAPGPRELPEKQNGLEKTQLFRTFFSYRWRYFLCEFAFRYVRV